MLNPAQTEVIGYMEEGFYHSHCAHQLDETMWEQMIEDRKEDGEDHWNNPSVLERFATERNGQILIRYSIDEEESLLLEDAISYLISTQWSDLPELVQEHLDEVFHDAWDSEDFPVNMHAWQQVVSDFAYDNYEELGIGFVYCDQCTERIGG